MSCCDSDTKMKITIEPDIVTEREAFIDLHRSKAQVNPEIDFEPLWDWVLVETIKKEKTEGGILLPANGSGEDDTSMSRVVAVGPGMLRDDGQFVYCPFRIGDIVYNITKMHKVKVKLDGKDYIAIPARDLVGMKRTPSKS